MKLINTLLVLPAVLLGATGSGLAADGPEAEIRRELLSRHETVARFEGVKEHICRGATGNCPDRCGSSGDLATFKIIKYTAYEKPGEYGDPRQKNFQFLIQDNMKNLKVSAATKAAVEALKVGDYVVLNWRHDYVTTKRSKSPDRPIQVLKPITKEEADKLPAAPADPPKEQE